MKGEQDMFDVTIQQKDLMKALTYLEPTVGKNSQNLGDNCLAMETTAIGSMKMMTNNTIEFSYLEVIVGSGATTVEKAPYVDFKRFKAIVASIPENEYISLKQQVNDLLINFSLKPTPIKLVGCGNGFLPIPTMSNTQSLTIPKNFFEQALNGSCSIIEESQSTPIYNCVRIATNAQEVEITGLDYGTKRMFMNTFQATQNNPQIDVLVEAGKLKKSLKAFEDFNELQFEMDGSTVCVTGADPVQNYNRKAGNISDMKYFCRRNTGVYPTNIAQSFVPGPAEYSEINKEDLMNAIARAKAVEDTSGGQHAVSFKVDGSNVVMALGSAYGNVEDNIKAENSVTRQINAVFKYDHLADILKVIDDATVEIGCLPNHPSYYVVRPKSGSTSAFTIAGMVAPQSSNP